MSTRFRYTFRATWTETRQEALDSGMMSNDDWPYSYKPTNVQIRRYLQRYTERLKEHAVPGEATIKVHVKIERV